MFKSARIKLTLWYLLLTMVVSIMFSAIIYRFMTIEIDRFEQSRRLRIMEQLSDDTFVQIPQGPMRLRMMLEDPELIQETKSRIFISLGVLNAGILVIAGFLGYFLAGRTLYPIQLMADEQTRFISDASHEIKTPLTSLRTAFEVFLRSDTNDPGEAVEIMRDSIAEVDKLHALSESMLQLAQFERPNQDVPKKAVSIKNVVETVNKKVKYLAEEKNIRMKRTIVDFDVRANKDQLVDLLLIILDNAIKYSPSRGTITISTLLKGSAGSLTISDSGMGIAPADIPHIFDRFFRSDKVRSRSGKNGYGLGLSIAQKIAVSQGIQIDVSSTVDVGTSFTLSFPNISTKA